MSTDDENDFGSPTYVRRLRRYEAAPLPAGTVAGMDFFSPFGPMISRVRAPMPLVDRVNRYADALIAAAGADAGTGGITLPEHLVREGGEDSLASHTARWMAQYLETADDRRLGKVHFESFWLARHFAGTFSPVHFHSGDISGVLYLQVPGQIENAQAEERQSYINARQAGYLTFLIGGKQRFAKSIVSFKPQVGDFYIFPGWLLHAVEPFRGQGERRAMSFNAYVE